MITLRRLQAWLDAPKVLDDETRPVALFNLMQGSVRLVSNGAGQGATFAVALPFVVELEQVTTA